ncbi:hypothetical protein K1X84_02255 [bacterium]|nr:hypothetical protein [bacterium]
MRLEHLSHTDGLSNDFIQCIVQDKYGFVWFGTKDGLNKFDGYRFTNYRFDENDSASISSNDIRALFEDSEGILWIGTSGGLCRFDPEMDYFVRYLTNEKNIHAMSSLNVWSICEDASGFIWIGTQGGGLNKLDKKTNTFIRYLNNPADSLSLPSDDVYSVLEDHYKNLWIGTTNKGLWKLNPERKSFHPVAFKDSSILALYKDAENNLWIGTRSGGLSRYDEASGKFTDYIHDEKNPKSLSHNRIHSLWQDSKGVIWIGTYEGINRFDPLRSEFAFYKNSATNLETDSNNYVHCIYEDRTGTVWLGTPNGIYYFYSHTPFDNWSIQNYMNESNSNVIRSLFEDSKGTLWIGLDGNGVLAIDQSNKPINYRHEIANPYSLSAGRILTIQESSDGAIWLGGSGICRFDRNSQLFTSYLSDPGNTETLSSNDVYAIDEDLKHTLWIGTWGGGLNEFSPSIGSNFIAYYNNPANSKSLSDNYIQAVHSDKNGRMWVGTSNAGLNTFMPTTYQDPVFVAYRMEDGTGLNSNSVNCIYEDKSGTIWVGTNSGLSKFIRDSLATFDPKKVRFKSYGVKEGFLKERVIGIREDKHGHLWLNAEGIVRFDPMTESFVHYGVKDGLVNETYNAICKRQDGTLLFGGNNGIDVFNPDSMSQNQNLPHVYITDFLVLNKSVLPRTSVLKKSVIFAEEAEIDYTDYLFAFEFAAISYYQQGKSQYAYMLEGFDREWIYTNADHRKAVYTNVSPGEYTFKIKASNGEGEWSKTETSLRLVIKPPWWKTWWAQSSFYGLGIFIILAVPLLRLRMSLRQNRILEEKVNLRTAELSQANAQLRELDRFKQGMMSMIVHDLKNPLNALLSDSPGESLMHRLESSKKIAGHMLRMVLNILDVQKFQETAFVLHTSQFVLNRMLERAVEDVDFLRKNKGLKIEMQWGQFEFKLEADEEIILRVVVNLLTNAIKFTPPGGKIIVKAEQSEDRVHITIEDEGPGIPADKLGSIFEPYNQVQAVSSGGVRSTGLGLTFCKMAVEAHKGTIGVESVVGHGSKFFLLLPLKHVQLGDEFSKTFGESNEISLNIEDKKEIATDLEILRTLDISEISELRNVLRQINIQNDNVNKWKTELESAIYAMDEKRYQELIEDAKI